MDTKNWIDGEWIIPQGNDIPVWSPSDYTEPVGVLHLSDASHMHQAGISARQALSKWGGLTGAQRGEYLYKAADTFERNLLNLAKLASSEMGKPIAEMRGEVMRAVHILRYYAGEGVRTIGSVIPANEINVLQYTKRVPLGVVGIITPWNFPVAIPIWKMAPALVSGNTGKSVV